MKKLSDKDKKMLLVMAAVLVLGGLFWFYVKPARSDLSAATDRVTAAQENVDTLNAELQKLVAMSSPKAKQNVADTLRLAKAYPSDRDVPETILQLERLSRQAGVSFTDGTPDAGTDIAGTTGTTFTISVGGSYFRVLDFVSRLHNQVRADADGRLEINGRLFAVTSAELKLAGEADGKVTSSSPVEASITAIAFSRTPAAAGGGAGTTPTSNTTTPSTGGATQ